MMAMQLHVEFTAHTVTGQLNVRIYPTQQLMKDFAFCQQHFHGHFASSL